ncbi:spermidine/putrescine ABC transporter ATP-binding protein [mine drainage metagenome]|uniref:Spermidine/putrescine ABC transporter ATP-binding protein n=1 Tax=mine drainage metagenome TaxID=410659 RepID=T1AAW3_9ZZZZ
MGAIVPSSEPPVLEVEDLSVSLGRIPVLDSVSFEVAPGELLSLMGPNGSGKTTLLRAIVGLERPARGTVRLHGKDLRDVPVHRRGIGLLLQEAALFPRRTVYENVAYGPLVQGRSLPEADTEARRALELVRMQGFEERDPATLSGGERQRVALARTIAAHPRVVLLDEPFAAIDAGVRAGLRGEFRHVLAERGIAAVHVTHDREEGLFLGDRVAILLEGRLRAIGAPTTVYDEPPDVGTARFLGYNLLPEGPGWVAFRPRDARLEPIGSAGQTVDVLAVGFTGRGSLVVARCASGERLEVELDRHAAPPRPGERLALSWERSLRFSR